MITITNWSDGTAIYSVEAVDLREAVQQAVKNRVSLAQAELVFVKLYGADLRGALGVDHGPDRQKTEE